jgi:hypothetical protein
MVPQDLTLGKGANLIFSQRYFRALKEGKLRVDVPDEARPKLATCLSDFDASFGVQRDPNDNWISHSSVGEEAIIRLMIEQGWESIPETDTVEKGEYTRAFQHVVRRLEPPILFDIIELALSFMERDEREKCRIKVNQIFDLHDCAWRIADGEFFKLDSDFIGARLTAQAHDHLAANRFVGASNEFAKARQELGLQDVKDAIIHAGKSFESVMKVMTGMEHANADQLIKAMLSQGYFDDLPESIRAGFAEQVMKTVPFLRNKLAGHGQGAQIVEVPPAYGELAVQLAAAFHNFLVSKHLEKCPPETQQEKTKPASASWMDDEIPF